MISPFENYFQSCRRRLRLWISDDVVVSRNGDCSILISRGSRALEMQFHPKTCDWSLVVDGNRSIGNFDRLTKQVRRLLTSSPL